jgi:hypothetical protein
VRVRSSVAWKRPVRPAALRRAPRQVQIGGSGLDAVALREDLSQDWARRACSP